MPIAVTLMCVDCGREHQLTVDDPSSFHYHGNPVTRVSCFIGEIDLPDSWPLINQTARCNVCYEAHRAKWEARAKLARAEERQRIDQTPINKLLAQMADDPHNARHAYDPAVLIDSIRKRLGV